MVDIDHLRDWVGKQQASQQRIEPFAAATLLLDLLRRELPAATLRSFQFRAHRPAFDTDPIQLCGRVDGQQVRLWTQGPQGQVGMSASAEIA